MQAPISMKLGPALKLSARIEEHRVQPLTAPWLVPIPHYLLDSLFPSFVKIIVDSDKLEHEAGLTSSAILAFIACTCNFEDRLPVFTLCTFSISLLACLCPLDDLTCAAGDIAIKVLASCLQPPTSPSCCSLCGIVKEFLLCWLKLASVHVSNTPFFYEKNAINKTCLQLASLVILSFCSACRKSSTTMTKYVEVDFCYFRHWGVKLSEYSVWHFKAYHVLKIYLSSNWRYLMIRW